MDPAKDQQIIQETLREAQLCDALGMEMLWLAEHHFDGICAYVDPVSFAAALAASTKQIHIGFAVAQMSLHHPIRMAEQMSLIDNISKGRLVVGLGRGTAYNIYDYQGYGIDPAEAHERLIEAEDIMIKAWTTENFEHEGKFWNMRLPLLRPRPYTKPHPPIVRACASEEAMLGMARAGPPVPHERPEQRGHAASHGPLPQDDARVRVRRGDRRAQRRRHVDLAQHLRRRDRRRGRAPRDARVRDAAGIPPGDAQEGLRGAGPAAEAGNRTRRRATTRSTRSCAARPPP